MFIRAPVHTYIHTYRNSPPKGRARTHACTHIARTQRSQPQGANDERLMGQKQELKDQKPESVDGARRDEIHTMIVAI
jgi:hypothetical protein